MFRCADPKFQILPPKFFHRHPVDAAEHHNLAADPQHQDTIKDLQKWIPQHPALPPGDTEWEGDKLDQLLDTWDGKAPDWLN